MIQLTWMRQVRGVPRMPVSVGYTGKPTFDLTATWETAAGEPAYFNGRFAVVDTVLDLEWSVIDTETMHCVFKGIDKYEAIREADLYLEAAML